MSATQEQYRAAFTAAWQKVQGMINALPPFEQSMARGALRADLIHNVVNAAVDAAMAATPSDSPKVNAERTESAEN